MASSCASAADNFCEAHANEKKEAVLELLIRDIKLVNGGSSKKIGKRDRRLEHAVAQHDAYLISVLNGYGVGYSCQACLLVSHLLPSHL